MICSGAWLQSDWPVVGLHGIRSSSSWWWLLLLKTTSVRRDWVEDKTTKDLQNSFVTVISVLEMLAAHQLVRCGCRWCLGRVAGSAK